MTRLACFYTSLDPRTRSSLEKYAPQAGLDVEWVETPGDSMVYANELEKRWTGEEDLILVEHDKEIFPSTLLEIMNCTGPWCACTYWLFPEPHTVLCIGGFGVTKFSAQIQREIKVSEFAGDSWLNIDRRFLEVLKARGIGCCLHSMVTHHHIYTPRPEMVRRHVTSLREQGMVPQAMAPPALDPGLLPGSYRLMPNVPAEA